MYVKYR